MYASSIVRAATALFEFIWAQSTPIPLGGRAQSGGDSILLDDEWSLLDYLATGMPDDAIARNLDVSSRTVRRRIGELAEKLGATSRFQLAVRAATHGWQDGSEREPASNE